MNDMSKIILDLCGGTGAWSKPYKDAGYDVRVITLPEFDITRTEIENNCIIFWSPMKINNLFIEAKDIYGIIAAPPCTMFSLARTTAKTPRNLVEGMAPVEMCMQIIWAARKHGSLKFWAVENPMGYLRQFLGKPAFTFDPSEFGEDYNKTTDLWGYFKEPKTKFAYKRAQSTDKNTRKLPPIPEDYERDEAMSTLQIRRSMTSKKFAKAFYEANK
jgi:hypothetical protein